jgi:hypothetical protein
MPLSMWSRVCREKRSLIRAINVTRNLVDHASDVSASSLAGDEPGGLALMLASMVCTA